MGRPIVTKPKIIKVSYDATEKVAIINLTTAIVQVPTEQGLYGTPYVLDGGSRLYLTPRQFRKAIRDGGGATLVAPSAGVEPRMIITTDHDDEKYTAIVMAPLRLD